ncbi:MAG: exodeoxyribonuclease VII large subunit [Bacteroidia bacterium]|nr:exodeoxyribonuclease VII large subunit [Bacteroidia bacterium]MCO5253086.1 exodeoxyribonuclease VII large subunit [Bacteroidota bacterium]MCZ2129751.1 exodeoxyribonuclease VII large subunit [Bacteroidia bacterium]
MSETINGRQIFTLFEVTKSIQKTISERYGNSYWIKAEIIKLNFYKHSGHCYPDLVDKQDGKVVAQMRSTMWRHDFLRINNEFERILKEPLKEGIKVLILARISFSSEHGISLNIQDIDASFTLGDLEKEKQETINKLKAEGIFNQNKSLKIPLLPQRIAVISVETSKGYADFVRVLEEAKHTWGYHFFRMLFPSLLQGDGAVRTIIEQLSLIRKVIHHFDVVVIVRGGGGDVGLSCYNHYELAQAIATFPLPVITGIGHSTNETVAEMVALRDAITPTKLAEMLIQQFHNFSDPVQEAEKTIVQKSRLLLDTNKLELFNTGKLFRSVTQGSLLRGKGILSNMSRSITQKAAGLLNTEKQFLAQTSFGIQKDIVFKLGSSNNTLAQLAQRIKLESISMINNQQTEIRNITKNIENMSPVNVLKRGYSIALHNGKPIQTYKQVNVGDSVDIVLYEGTATSIIQSTSKKSKL